MKQEIKVVALALAMVLIFLSGVIVGKTTGEIKISLPENSTLINNEVNAGGTGGSAPVNGGATNTGNSGASTDTNTGNSGASTDANTGNAGSTDTNTGDAGNAGSTDTNTGDAGNAGSTDTNTGDAGNAGASTGVPSTKEEVAAAYCKALNDFKHYTGGVTLKRSETIDIQVKDLPKLAEAVINPIVSKFIGTTVRTFTFENNQEKTYDEGSGPQPSDDRSISDRIVPGNRDATIDPAGLVSATATPGANGGYSIKLVFVAETAKYDGTTKTNISEPTHHKGAMDPLNLGGIKELEGIITAADMSYPGATIEADIDGQGRLVKMHYNLPLEGSGTGKAVVTLTLGVQGSMDAVYEITYA